jgi:hypothetical protein
LLETAGWRTARAPGEREDEPGAAAGIVRGGAPALYVPAGATSGGELRRILVLHDGKRDDRAGMDAADEAAVVSGAEIVVLHVPPSAPSTSTASLPFRVADHGSYDWAEWREEFMRRFCRCSPGVRVALHIGGASSADLRREVRDMSPDLVIVTGATKVEPGAGSLHEVLFDGAVPVLIVPTVGRAAETVGGQAAE